MALISRNIEVRWHGNNKKHYESMGYIFTGRGQPFKIPVTHLLNSSNVLIDVMCDYCYSVFETRYSSYMRSIKRFSKDACVKCSHKKSNEVKILNSGSLFDRYPDLVMEWHPLNKNSPKQYNYGSSQKVKWFCSTGHDWEAAIRDRIKGRGCPICSESKGERRVANTLESLGIEYQREVSFKELTGIGGGNLRYDFGVYDKGKLTGLIEYDGIYHFQKVFEGDSHELIKKHDVIKDEYLNRIGMPLIRIPYTEIELIEELVEKFVKDLGIYY